MCTLFTHIYPFTSYFLITFYCSVLFKWELPASLRLSKDVVLCSGAGERYAYRRNPGWTLINFTNLERPSSKLSDNKGWFSFKGCFNNLLWCDKLEVIPESFFYHWFFILSFCIFFFYSGFLFKLNFPHFFLTKTESSKVIVVFGLYANLPVWCTALTPSSFWAAFNKDSGNIRVLLQHQSTGQTGFYSAVLYSRPAEFFEGFCNQTPPLSLTQNLIAYQFLGP